jgi:hypothetical protein
MLIKRRSMKSKPHRMMVKKTPAAIAGVLADYLNTDQLAAELNVAPLNVDRWRRAKHGPPFTLVGRKVLYRRASVEEWLAAQEQKRS